LRAGRAPGESNCIPNGATRCRRIIHHASSPSAQTPKNVRTLASLARLLNHAVYEIPKTKTDSMGHAVVVEILVQGSPQPSGSRCSTRRRLERIGVTARSRRRRRRSSRPACAVSDFEHDHRSWCESLAPGHEQLEFWGSRRPTNPSRATHSASRTRSDALTRLIFPPRPIARACWAG